MTNEEIAKVLAEIDTKVADAMNAIFNKSTELAMFHIGVASCHLKHLTGSLNLKTTNQNKKEKLK